MIYFSVNQYVVKKCEIKQNGSFSGINTMNELTVQFKSL